MVWPKGGIGLSKWEISLILVFKHGVLQGVLVYFVGWLVGCFVFFFFCVCVFAFVLVPSCFCVSLCTIKRDRFVGPGQALQKH